MMGLRHTLRKLMGKPATATTPLAADQTRAQDMPGRETRHSSTEQDGARQRMETELAGQRTRRAGPAPGTEVSCPHTVLVPRWDTVADMGHEDRVSSYTCEGCQQQFPAADGRALRQTEAERVRQRVEG